MTVLVGVLCSDSVVVGADSVSTSAVGVDPLVHLPANSKIITVGKDVVVAATGAVGLSQRLASHVEQAHAGQVFKNLKLFECITNISKRFLTDCQQSRVQRHPHYGLGFGALVAAVIQGEPHLIEYGTTDFQPELKRDKLFFVSMGSGQRLADPFLAFIARVIRKGSLPTVEEAKFGVYWVLDHTIKLAPGGVGGPAILSTLSKKDDAWTVEIFPDTQEQAQYIAELEMHIGSFARDTIEEADAVPPPAVPEENA